MLGFFCSLESIGQKIFQASHLLSTQCTLGEGAFWDGEKEKFWFVDIEEGKVHTFPYGEKNWETWEASQKVGTVVPEQKKSGFIIGLEDGIYKAEGPSSKPTLLNGIPEIKKPARLNDGKCDPQGRFWVGGIHHDKPHTSYLYYRNETGELFTRLDSVSVSNGICWRADGKKMYYIDTPTKKVRAFDYDLSTGNISNEKTVIQIPDSLGWPDGMAIDLAGNVWIGMWGGACVSAWSPESGKLLALVKVPALQVTSCAFGGKKMDKLIITTARVGLSPEQLKTFPLSGDIFEADVEASGGQMPYWNGK